MASKRAFRTEDSFREEKESRDLVVDFLEARGFREVADERTPHGLAESQTIRAVAPSGHPLVMRVRLCWRPRRSSVSGRTAASQLMARVDGKDWERSIQAKLDRQKEDGVTHLLIVKRVGRDFPFGALIPLDEVLPVWCAQRDVSKAMIERGELGRRQKNHAMNGSSPTLWLMDDRAPAVAAQLWNHPRVLNLSSNSRDLIALLGSGALDDTLDDLPRIEPSAIGSDCPARYTRIRSYVRRDPRVRAGVLRRARGQCERPGCGEARTYVGFLDVHHVFGVATSDRVTNCVAVCPNCHREAHFSPESESINAQLLAVARMH